MARSSLGTDVFSPVRFELSFDENIINTEVKSDRDSISEKLRRPSTQRFIENYKSVASLEKKSSRKIDAVPEEIKLKISKKSITNGITSSEAIRNKQQLIVPNSLKILKSPNKDLKNTTSASSKNDELLLKKSKSRRSKDEKNDQEKNKKDKNVLLVSNEVVASIGSTKTSTDTLASKFVTVRRERNKSDCTLSGDILLEHSEKVEEKTNAIPSVKKDCKKSFSSRDLSTNGNKIASSKMEPIVELESLYSQDKPQKTRTISSEKIHSRKHLNDKSLHSGSAVPNQFTQVQHGVIEKLISDTVSYEFDGIRRQMYLQQISILKLLNQRMDEFEVRHTNTTQALYEIIDDLLKENRKLKNALLINH